MLKGLLSVYSTFFLSTILLAQMPVASFNVNASSCKQQQISFENTSTDADQYQWDFCLEDFLTIQSTNTSLATLTGFNAGYGYKLIEDNGQWFGFLTSRANHKLYRLDFGDNPTNAPAVTDLGNPDGKLFQPEGIDIFQHEGNWYGFVGSLAFSSPTQGVIRLDFGNSLQSTPTAINLGNFGLTTRFRDLKVVQQSSNLILLLVNYNNNAILRINYRDSFDNTISASDITSTGTIANANLPVGLDIIQRGSSWIALLASLNNSEIVQLNFNSDFLSTPVVEAHYTFTGMTRPYKIKMSKEGSKYYAIVSNESVPVTIIDFKDLDPVNPPTKIEHSGLPTLLAIENIRINGTEVMTGVAASGTNFSRVIFEAECGASISYIDEQTPANIYYNNEGDYEIELTAINGSSGNKSITSRVVNILNLVSPDITFSSQNLCAQHDINFFSSNQSGDITNYQWDFDDGTTLSQSDLTSPTHIYTTASTYYPSLTVTASNGCQNFVRDTLKIYDPPSAGFTLPSGLLCTNNNFMFINTTTDVYDSNLTYQWFVDDTEASADRDLLYAFNSMGIKNIKLITSIPGCSNEIIQSTSEVKAGPVVDFSFSGHCEDQQVTFTNSISDDVDDYLWNFGDGNISGSPNPENVFTSAGDYSVSLTATSPNGCNNSHVKEVTIYSNPSVDFATNPPPHSCSGSSTAFTNLTADPFDGTVTSWLWVFDDESDENESTLQDPSHVFVNAGTFNVSLTATTNQGCSGTLQKPIEIFPSPLASIENSPACNGVSTNFTAQGNDIVYYYWEIGTSYYEEKDAIHTFNAPGDYEVKLIVQGNNNCETTVTQNISVPAPLVPDFSVTKNCAGYEAVFTDITSGVDPVISQQWEFAAIGNGSGSPATFTFTDTGNKSVTLKVTAQSGCSYITTKTVNIIQAPVAGFTVFPEEGGAPLEVQFTNTSTGATQYAWAFGDVSTSTEVSPLFIFQDAGDFTTVLTASNNAGCESTFAKSINVLTPLPDVDVRNINVLENPDGTMNVIVTLQNKGNTFLKGLPLDVDLSGKVKLREVIEESIAPSSLYNVILDYAITDPDAIGFLCVQTFLEGDLAPDGNRVCIELNEEAHWFMPYPNPVSDLLVLEWISPEEQPVKFELVDAFGKISLRAQVASHVGLNRTVYDVSNLRSGVYMLVFSSGSTSSTRRILITGQN